MSSETDICNEAISEFGDKQITSLTDGSVNAIRCSNLYQTTRDATLEAYDWTFARKRKALTKLAGSPVFEFDNKFQLPNDCLRPLYTGDELSSGWPYRVPPSVQSVWVNTDEKLWQVEGRTLLSNDDTVDLIYTARITSPDDWTSMFKEAVVAHLAARLAYAITRSIQAKRDWMAYYQSLVEEAASVDAQVGDDEGWHRDDITIERI